jgi:heme/copper-type cytochrome/quinol oxidase subunit 1
MPRRIPDFPDAYTEWNTIASLGSFITLFSTLLFAYIVYITLTSNLRIAFNPWKSTTNFVFNP